MKKLLALLLGFLIIICVGFATFQPMPYKANQLTIYDYLRNEMNFSEATSCGMLANIYYESKFEPHLYGDNGTSYGICQWHNTRFTRLKKFAKKKGLDYRELETQLQFLNYELLHHYKKTVYMPIKKVKNSVEGAKDAANIWCRHFERPADVENEVKKRTSRAASYYSNLYDHSFMGKADLDTKTVNIKAWVSNEELGDVKKSIKKGNAYYFNYLVTSNRHSLPINSLATHYMYRVQVKIYLEGKHIKTSTYDHKDTLSIKLKANKTGHYTYTIIVTGKNKKTYKGSYGVK